jgi:hypothetical protein
MRPPLRFIFCFALFAVGPCSSSAGAQTAVVMPGHHLRSAIWFSARYSYDEGPIAPPSSNIAVRHCTIMNCYGRAVAFYHTTDSEVVGCRISAINDEAIDFDHFALRCRAIGNWIDGATIGLELNDASHCVVRHNTIQRVRIGAKIWWYSKFDPEGLNEHNVIEHNTIGPVEEKAIFIGRNCHNNRVAHNFLSGDVSVVEASNIVVANSR